MPLAVLSPAKTLDESPLSDFEMTEPAKSLAQHRDELLALCCKLKKADLMKMMKISDKIAQLNLERFAGFASQPAKAAAWAFDGPAHKALDMVSLGSAEQAYAQQHVITLSGLYGFLRPRDAMRPYRLEMGTKLQTSRGSTLYDFWDDRVALELAKLLKVLPQEQRFVVNVASQEYWGVLAKHTGLLDAPVYTIEFPGPSVYAKQARGLFCRFLCCQQVVRAEQLREFAEWTSKQPNCASYKFVEGQDASKLCFHRGTASSTPKPTASKAPKRGKAQAETTCGDEGSIKGYTQMKVGDLRKALAERDADTKGNKAALVQRMVELEGEGTAKQPKRRKQ